MSEQALKNKLKDFEKRLSFSDKEIDGLKEALKAAKDTRERTIDELRALMRDASSGQGSLEV